MSNITSILLGLTSLVSLIGGWQVLGKYNHGTAPHQALIPLLAILGLVTLSTGVVGYFRARAAKQMMPLTTSLSMVIGALALLMALYFLLP